jgi:hypothetical protein
MRNGINRRQTNKRAATIEHAVGLMRTHGISYASRYLKNQKFSDETIARVLSGKPGVRRALPRTRGVGHSWSDEEGRPGQTSIRQLSYKVR